MIGTRLNNGGIEQVTGLHQRRVMSTAVLIDKRRVGLSGRATIAGLREQGYIERSGLADGTGVKTS